MSGDTAFERLDEVVHQRTRLGVLTILAEVKSASFTYLRDELDLSDGNLSRHLRVLEDAGLVSITKSLAISQAPDIRVNAVAPGVVDTRWVADWPEFVAMSKTRSSGVSFRSTSKISLVPSVLPSLAIMISHGRPVARPAAAHSATNPGMFSTSL